MPSLYSLISISLPKPFSKHEIETILQISLKKGIDKAFFSQREHAFIVYTQFNVITFINYERDGVCKALAKLGLKDAEQFEQYYIFQDYPILIKPNLEKSSLVNNEQILLKEPLPLYILIIALVVSQSVGLEKYEQDLERHFEKRGQLLDLTKRYSLLKRSKLVEFARNLTDIRHGMVNELFLLDKPNILWDNEEAETLYNRLSFSLELKDRFEVVEHKLLSLKDDISMALDLFNHKHSEFLEWIIIILIGVEIILGLIEFFS